MQYNLFAYGTLMVQQILHAVTGIDRAGMPGLLFGYQRRLLRGEVYPGIRPDRQARVAGILYANLTQPAWQRLDRFEGELYRRETVEVALADHQRMRAQTYVLKPQYYGLLSREPWTLEQFLNTGISPFVAGYRGFDQLSETE
jgi:gamma-glutamylcyclotransferase (GGCT)/AIG2-like uncharacterized protein YtfP